MSYSDFASHGINLSRYAVFPLPEGKKNKKEPQQLMPENGHGIPVAQIQS